MENQQVKKVELSVIFKLCAHKFFFLLTKKKTQSGLITNLEVRSAYTGLKFES